VIALPGWLAPLERGIRDVDPEELAMLRPPPGVEGRPSAVLVLFGEGVHGPDLLFIERAGDLRAHAGQPAFPGGAVDPDDDGPVATALREAHEEVGVDPDGVHVFATLPGLWIPPSGFVVNPVLAWWHDPCDVDAVDPREVAAVERIPLVELADPANRVWVRTLSGHVGPGFRVRELVVWGFTGGLVDRILDLGGWAVPWDTTEVLDRPGGTVSP
jgi:8-oxo-dGTP pyrophosphatase MutT (NUDIX family)